MMFRTQTAPLTPFVETRIPQVYHSPSSIIVSSLSTLSLAVIQADPPAAVPTATLQPTLGPPILLYPVQPISIPSNDGFSPATIGTIMSLPVSVATPSPVISSSAGNTPGQEAASQLSSPLASASGTSESSRIDYTPVPVVSITTAASVTTIEAKTTSSTPAQITQSSLPPELSPPVTSTLRTVAVSTITPTPKQHTGLSTAATSGIAISSSLAAIVLIVFVGFLWRKKRSAEATRRNDLESKAIWVTKTFTVVTESGSGDSNGGGGSSGDVSKDSAILAKWPTVPSEDAKIAKRWADVDVIGGLTRWSNGRKGVQQLRG